MKSATVALLIAAILNGAAAAPQYPHSYVASRAEPGAPQSGYAAQPAPPAVALANPKQIQSLTDGLHLNPKDLSQLGNILSYFQKGTGQMPGDLTGIVSKLLGLGADDTVKRVLQTLLHLCGPQPSGGSKPAEPAPKPAEPAPEPAPKPAEPSSKPAGPSYTPAEDKPKPADSDPKPANPDPKTTTDSKTPEPEYSQPKNPSAGPNKGPAGGDLGKLLPGGLPLGGAGPINPKDLPALIANILKVPQSLVEKILMVLGLGGGKGPLAGLTGGLTGGAGPLGSVGKLTGGLGAAPKGAANALPVEVLPNGLGNLGGGLGGGAALPLPGGALATADAKGDAHP